jgi:hypothetical protein
MLLALVFDASIVHAGIPAGFGGTPGVVGPNSEVGGRSVPPPHRSGRGSLEM